MKHDVCNQQRPVSFAIDLHPRVVDLIAELQVSLVFWVLGGDR